MISREPGFLAWTLLFPCTRHLHTTLLIGAYTLTHMGFHVLSAPLELSRCASLSGP